MAHHDKDIKYVGDSRVPAKKYDITAPSYSEFPGKTEPFWPNFLLKEWMVGAVVLLGYLVLVVSHPPEVGDIADPNNTSYIPLPDWYFLFLYQLLKYPWASGDFVVIGTVILPGLAFGALTLAPFLDTSSERRFYKRPVASGLMLVSLVAIFYLTWASMAQYHAEHGGNQAGGGHEAPPAVEEPKDGGAEGGGTESAGAQIWAQQTNCMGCHGQNMEGGAGPALTNLGEKYSAEELKNIIQNGIGNQMPGGMFVGTEEELDTLVDYLLNMNE